MRKMEPQEDIEFEKMITITPKRVISTLAVTQLGV